MIERTFDTLRAVVDDVVVSVRHDSQRYDVSAEHVVDRYRGLGPLAGLDAAFSRVLHDWVFVLACDLPQCGHSDVRRIVERCEAPAEAVVAMDSDEMLQPLCGCYYKPAAEREAKQLLQRHQLSMMGLLKRLEVVPVALSEEALINVNRRADLKMLSLL
jgi:molybdopterin-guanine dinucleotide biosynthesis protein A